MSSFCLACGISVANSTNNRVLKRFEGSLFVWRHICNSELKVPAEDTERIVSAGGRICRKCFSGYERCATLIKSLKDNACSAMRVLGVCATLSTCDIPPAPKRAAVATSSSHCAGTTSSPDVQV